MPSAKATISLTEVPQFKRLVVFVEEVERHAEEHDDYALKSLVNAMRDDLLRTRSGDDA